MFIRTKLALACTALLLSASSVLAFEVVSFNTIKGVESIDSAVGDMPSSNIIGTLNRFSALYQRSHVSDIPHGQFTQLPANFANGMSNALEDLQTDWVEGTGGLTAEQKYALIQAIEVVVSSRLVDLYATAPPCVPVCDGGGPCFCFDVYPPAIQMLNGIIELFRGDIDALIAQHNALSASDLDPLPTKFAAGNFDSELDRIRTPLSLVLGVESIDD